MQPSHGAIFGIVPQSRAFACLVGINLPTALMGFSALRSFAPAVRVSGRFRPFAPTCRYSPSSIPTVFSSGDGRRVLKPTSISDGRSRTHAFRLLGFIPARKPYSADDQRRHQPLLPWASPLAGFADGSVCRTAPRPCSNTSPRRQPWGACFHRLPIRS